MKKGSISLGKAFQAPIEEAVRPITVQNDIEGPFDAEGTNLISNPVVGAVSDIENGRFQPQQELQPEIQPQPQLQVNQAQGPPPMLISGQVPVAQPGAVASFQPQPFAPAPYVVGLAFE